jgi:hypothetical protein
MLIVFTILSIPAIILFIDLVRVLAAEIQHGHQIKYGYVERIVLMAICLGIFAGEIYFIGRWI